ncbi:MAG: site-specific integrase [Bacteroidetes bacterium]|nr:site-specific integrase [Bacteroidota bacterium]
MNKSNEIENYLSHMGHTKQTIKSYMYAIKNFLQSNPEAEIYKYKDILNYLNEKVKDFSNSDIKNGILAAVKKYYDFLIDIGLRNDHPCKTLILSKRRNRDIIHQDLFTTAELEMLMEREERYEILKLKSRTLISILIYQGITAGEVANIKVSNVDLDNGTLYIKGTGKTTSRHLELIPKQYRIIDRYINETRKKLISTKTDRLLVGKLGTPVTVDDVNYMVSTYKSLFPDRNLNALTIRMSVISNWLNEKRLPLEQVQLMAGHRWISATIRYRYTPLEEQREMINKFHPLR